MLVCRFLGIVGRGWGRQLQVKGGRGRTYGELDTIRKGEVSLNACAVAARAASARSVAFILFAAG